MIAIGDQPILTAAAMRRAEDAAAGDDLWPLMERAGRAVAAAVRRLAAGAEVLVLCGPGNNGGDGYVAAAALAARGANVRVAASAEPASDLARRARSRWSGAVERLGDAGPAPVLVDALFGTGLSRPLGGDVAAALTRLVGAATLSIAVDLPSGVATDDGALLGVERALDLTLALGAVKPAHLLLPAAPWCGTVRLLDIGIAADGDDRVLGAPAFPAPAPDAHKFTRGMVAVVAGRMPGATALAATAAAHAAGYVLLLGSTTDRLPHAIVRRRWDEGALADDRIGAVVVGPGLGRDDEARRRLAAALASDRALVIDGDALHLLDLAALRDRTAPVILTPHAGEFAHLFGTGGGSRIERARTAATSCGATVVLKGPDTVIAAPDGATRVAHHRVPWLATAGSGDVLAGLAGALLAQGRDPFRAAQQAVWLHTQAALHAGPAFVADDLAAAIPAAIGAA